jgi:hypothetical protein
MAAASGGAGVIFSGAIEGEKRMLSRNTAFTSS